VWLQPKSGEKKLALYEEQSHTHTHIENLIIRESDVRHIIAAPLAECACGRRCCIMEVSALERHSPRISSGQAESRPYHCSRRR
jgi:predicted NBD/HSP70 family sugar kinase